MGKGYIMSGGEAGLYEMKVVYDEDGLDRIVESCNRRIEAIDERIAELEEEIAPQETEVRQTKDALNAAVIEWQAAWDEYKDSFGTADDGLIEINQNLPSYQELAEAQADYETAKAKLRNLESALALKQYQRKQQELQIQRIQVVRDRLDADRREVWCADLTEDLSGPVGTIEVNGEPNQIIIYPEGEAGHGGELTPINGQSAAQAGFNWAILPGWQRHEPTHRVGTITAIDYDAHTATVALDEAASVAQGLGINQAEELKNIPVDYMDCDAYAFDVADRVVVEFAGQDWADSKVIGFETNPQPCNWYAGVVGSTDWSGPQVEDPRIIAWYPGYPVEDDPGEDKDSLYTYHAERATVAPDLPESPYRYNNLYKPGSKVKIGCSWKYPFEERNGIKQKILLDISMKIVDSDGVLIQSIPIQVNYGSGFEPGDKAIANPEGKTYATYNYRHDYDGHWGETIQISNSYCPKWDGEEIWQRTSAVEFVHRAYNLNTIPLYYMEYSEQEISWIEEGHWDDCGNPPAHFFAGPAIDYSDSNCGCHFPSCENSGEKYCGDLKQTAYADYWALNYRECLIDSFEIIEPEELYIEQSWSMEGTIQEDGIHLSDVAGGGIITVGDIELPLSTFASENATLGPAIIGIEPVSENHHVYFEIESALTFGSAGGVSTAIEELDLVKDGGYVDRASDWYFTNRRVALNSNGYAHFYAVIERPRE